ncbi:MAG: alpha/beta hydrolase [Actinomycetota bacterium]|nr:alpha/beta hydrolase [Actinomycetota bacterium]
MEPNLLQTRLTPSLPWQIALSALRTPARHRYGPHRSQVADLHLPPGPGPHPVAVVLHGGYWQGQYGKVVTRPLCLDLVRRGWAAWNLEYRRLGRDRGGWPATFEDVAAGIDYLWGLGDPRLDLDRVTAVGHSAGGQLALWAGARPRFPAGAPGGEPRVMLRQIVALAAVCNLEKAGRTALALVGGRPDEYPERWEQADPMRQVPLDIPVLLVHPRDDATVSVQVSREYAAAAEARGGHVSVIEPEAGGHRAPIDPSEVAWQASALWMMQRETLDQA